MYGTCCPHSISPLHPSKMFIGTDILVHSLSLAFGWKNQRISPSIVKQALMCEQAGYMIFRHSRSPSLATILESQLEDDAYHVINDIGNGSRTNLDGRRIDYRKERLDDVGLGLLVA